MSINCFGEREETAIDNSAHFRYQKVISDEFYWNEHSGHFPIFIQAISFITQIVEKLQLQSPNSRQNWEFVLKVSYSSNFMLFIYSPLPPPLHTFTHTHTQSHNIYSDSHSLGIFARNLGCFGKTHCGGKPPEHTRKIHLESVKSTCVTHTRTQLISSIYFRFLLFEWFCMMNKYLLKQCSLCCDDNGDDETRTGGASNSSIIVALYVYWNISHINNSPATLQSRCSF